MLIKYDYCFSSHSISCANCNLPPNQISWQIKFCTIFLLEISLETDEVVGWSRKGAKGACGDVSILLWSLLSWTESSKSIGREADSLDESETDAWRAQPAAPRSPFSQVQPRCSSSPKENPQCSIAHSFNSP